MRKFLALLRVSIQSMLLTATGFGRRKKKKTATGIGAMVLMAGLALWFSGNYSFILMSVLAPLGKEGLVLTFMGVGALVGGLLFTTFAVKGVVFSGRDNDLLLSMPVSSTLLMTSRVTAIYVENLVFSVFMLFPAGVACAILTERGVGHDLLFWVRLTLAAVALPLLDTALSVLMGALVAFVSSRLSRGKALGQNLVMAVYMLGVFWFCTNLSGMLNKLTSQPQEVLAGLSWVNPLVWLGESILGNWLALAGFLACCILPFGVMVFILGKAYRKAVTAFQAQSARSDYKLSAQTAVGQTRALLKKEARRFFGTPMYFWNSGMGLILLLVLAVAALVKRNVLAGLISLAEAAGQGSMVLPLAGLVIGVCLSTCVIAAPSISLEGRYLWILKEAPVREARLLQLKAGFELMLTLPCTVIASVCAAIATGMAAWQGMVLLAAMVLYAVAHACFSLLMGLTFPKLDAPNETIVIKQSMAATLSMLVPIAVLGVGGFLWRLTVEINQALALALPVLLFGVMAAASALILVKRGPAMLRAL